MHYTETELHLLRQEIEQPRWLAFLLALCVHGAVAVAMAYMPSLFVSKPVIEEVVSVSLVAMPEIGGAPAALPEAASAPAKPTVEKTETPPPSPPSPKPAVQPEPVAPPEELAPTPKEKVAVSEPIALNNPISLAPDQRKIKKIQDTRLEEEKVKEREQAQRKQEEREILKKIEERRKEAERKEAQRREEERQKALAQARLEQIKADNELREARALAAQANAAAAAVRADANRRTQAVQNAGTGGSSGRQQAQSIVEQTYWSTVAEQVKKKWVLPEGKWDANLLAMVVITINKNGEVTRIQFDQRSTEPLFDQLVEKTIRSASPMPRFPALMQQETTEVGFKFRPGELGNM